MTNVFKHSKATEIVLNFIKNDHSLNITLYDNGIGIPISKLKSKRGIKNMIERTNSINGNIAFEKKKGTLISFKILLIK